MSLLLNIKLVVFTFLLLISTEKKPIVSINLVCDTFVQSKTDANDLKKKFNDFLLNLITSDPTLTTTLEKLKKEQRVVNIHISFTDSVRNNTTTQKVIVIDFIRSDKYNSTMFYKKLDDLLDDLDKNDPFLQKGIHNFLVIAFMNR